MRRVPALALGFVGLLAVGVGAHCDPVKLPPLGHVRVHLDTDAPVPLPAGRVPGPDDLTPLFDVLRVEVDGGACPDCRREFALDVDSLREGMSFTLTRGPSRVRLRMFRSLSYAVLGDDAQAAEAFYEIPAPPAEGALDVTLFVPVAALETPIGSEAAPAPAEVGERPSRVGTWSGAQRTPCNGDPPPGMVCVPGGAYWMGNPLVYDGTEVSGGAERLVVLSPFFLDAREVSVGELRSIEPLIADGVTAWSGFYLGDDISDWCTYALDSRRHDALPANCIDRTAAITACRARGATLPTEAQREYVASTLGTRIFPWGSDLPNCNDAVHARTGVGYLAAFDGSCRREGERPGGAIGYPRPVDREDVGRDVVRLPSGGLVFDLAGNLGEWTRDAYQDRDAPCWSASPPRVFVDPLCASPPGAAPLASIRGGSFLDAPVNLTAQKREGIDADTRLPLVGFRCARDAR